MVFLYLPNSTCLRWASFSYFTLTALYLSSSACKEPWDTSVDHGEFAEKEEEQKKSEGEGTKKNGKQTCVMKGEKWRRRLTAQLTRSALISPLTRRPRRAWENFFPKWRRAGGNCQPLFKSTGAARDLIPEWLFLFPLRAIAVIAGSHFWRLEDTDFLKKV